MNGLRDALPQYVALRRALGTKLQEPARTLERFLGFLESEGSEFITSELALRWAIEPQGVQRATWARRLGMVRRFAAWFNTIDARTEVPPHRLLGDRTAGPDLHNADRTAHRYRPPPWRSAGPRQIRRRSRNRYSRNPPD